MELILGNVFWNVTIPSMTPIIFYNLLMSLITNMQVVTPALALTNGGPENSSSFLTYLLYRYAFISNRLGYACSNFCNNFHNNSNFDNYLI